MSDFETVRGRLNLTNDAERTDALAALDRIEAEVERMDRGVERLRKLYSDAHSEIERLQQRIIEAETRPALSQRIKELEAEVEQLREMLDERDKHLAVVLPEVERLRATIEEFENDPLLDSNKTLKAEVERLRAENEGLVDCARVLEDYTGCTGKGYHRWLDRRDRALDRVAMSDDEVDWDEIQDQTVACAACGETLRFADAVVHHINHDKTDNDPSNLATMHRGCHRKAHAKGTTTHKS